jgi:hypothetical protein
MKEEAGHGACRARQVESGLPGALARCFLRLCIRVCGYHRCNARCVRFDQLTQNGMEANQECIPPPHEEMPEVTAKMWRRSRLFTCTHCAGLIHPLTKSGSCSPCCRGFNDLTQDRMEGDLSGILPALHKGTAKPLVGVAILTREVCPGDRMPIRRVHSID